MSFFNKMKEPVFLKESSDLEKQIEELKELEPFLTPEGQAKLRQDVTYLEYGLIGEKNIAFELKNSHMPMYILHDIYLEDQDLSAQIDYLVFTRKLCFVIECKNLYGNIEINSQGDFIRTVEYGGRRRKEGFYSPITQNQRHLELMKKIKLEQQKNFFMRAMMERYFKDFYRPVVVLANPRTLLDNRCAPKEVKENVIRADQLVAYIKNVYNQTDEAENSDERLRQWAQSFLNLHTDAQKDYTGKYDKYRRENKIVGFADWDTGDESENEAAAGYTVESGKAVRIDSGEPELLQLTDESPAPEDTELYRALKEYRLLTSRAEKIKAYYIFNDNQLLQLVTRMPGTKGELLQISGFGGAKVAKYGDDILKIIKDYGDLFEQ